MILASDFGPNSTFAKELETFIPEDSESRFEKKNSLAIGCFLSIETGISLSSERLWEPLSLSSSSSFSFSPSV